MNFQSFDLNLLRVLDALLDTHSTTLAGRKLQLSQPAVSSSLSRLRVSLGDPLFVRQGRRIVPTERAEALRVPLKLILEEVEQVLSGADANEVRPEVQLGADDLVAELILPQLSQSFGDSHPDIRLNVSPCTTSGIEAMLLGNEADLVIAPVDVLPSWADSHALFEARPVVVARQDHPVLADAGIVPGTTMPIAMFCALSHVQFTPAVGTDDPVKTALARRGRTRHVAVSTPVYAGVYTTVARSDHIALLPAVLAERVAEVFGLDIYLPPVSIPAPLVQMVWHRKAGNSDRHRQLRQHVVEACRDLGAVGLDQLHGDVA